MSLRTASAALFLLPIFLPRAEAQPLPLIYDPALKPEEIQAIDNDIAQLNSAIIHGESIKWFPEIFGGNGSADVVTYLGNRVTTILAASTKVEPILHLFSDTQNSINQTSNPNQPEEVAANIGSAIFFYVVEKDAAGAWFPLGQNTVTVQSTRAGVMQLGENYTTHFGSELRVMTMVHEARHSDCTGGLSDADKARVRAGQDPVDKKCGHLHIVCTSGTYKGLPGCDDHPWGAYSVEAVFEAAIALACDNCTPDAKHLAEAVFADSASRYSDFKPMIDGALGPPDMQQTEVSLP